MSMFTTQAVATISPPTSHAADTVVDAVSNELLLPGKIELVIEPALLSRPSGMNEDESDSPLSLGKSEAAMQGALVLRDLRAGTRAVIDAGVRTTETIKRYQDDPEAIDVFMATLAEGKFISENERRLGRSSPKLSKLYTIGDHARFLRRDEILEHFLETGSSGYSVVYQLVVYYNTLQGDEEARFEQVVASLRAQRPSSRKAFSDLTQQAKKANTLSTVSELGATLEKGQRFDLILATLDHRRDRRRLSDDYVDLLPYCLRMHEQASERSVAVVVGRIADLPAIENKLLAGFVVSQILLLQQPLGADVTEAQVAVVALRGCDNELISEFSWLPHGEQMDAISLAEQLVPNTKNKLRLFATGHSEGWISVIGEANWSQADD
ncbi:hypothetical protein [Bradyrhizobium sp. RDI18]|uniref:hypothetical protein n=1 Tax=Bradyrhizobium sp. RDI18 TaxID=3367400 RepID=UPI003713DDA4